MTTSIIPAPQANIAPYAKSASQYARRSKAANTERAYRGAWKKFTAWCGKTSVLALPATTATIVGYVASMADAGAKFSTIRVHHAAISYAHRISKVADPTDAEEVRVVMSGIARKIGTAPQKKAPIVVHDLHRMVESIPDTLVGKRDRAILVLGWAGAFRRSELVTLEAEDIHLNGDLKVTLRQSKTDQEGRGMVKVIPPISDKSVDPITALRAWLDASGIRSGPIFRQIDRWGNIRAEALSPQTVAIIVKKLADAIGLESRQLAGHSLRSGLITSAANAGVQSRDIMNVSGHKSEMVMGGYIQDAGLGAKRAILAAFGEKV